ncbi:MAG TPA: hypothetical protein PK176_09745 [Acidobacteriota bacterium]|nr:hypothetical protein [Acidobacteriota bacterium]HQM63582.1 hypothetical protein [Acidobacteriota bacterium]
MLYRAFIILLGLAAAVTGSLSAHPAVQPDPPDEPQLQDRVVAEVSGIPVSRRELLFVASLIEGRVVAPDERSVLETALNRLSDQLIIRQELVDSMGDSAKTADIETMAARIRDHCGGAEKLAAIQAVFAITPAEYADLVERQALVVEFLRTYFRPFVVIAPEEITAFYTDELLPQLPPDTSVPPVEQVRDYVVRILEQRKINTEFTAWIAQRRVEAAIRIIPED